jgi:FkbM family methyltransferase
MLPKRFQVPAKYWYRWVSHQREPKMRHLGMLVQMNDLAIDGGANRGVYTYQFNLLGANIEAFEPNPVCHQVLFEWAVAKPCIRLHAVALSDSEGSAILRIPADRLGVEHDASASNEQHDFAQSREQVVALRKLDNHGFEGVSLFKIEFEGHEYGVIQGAAHTLPASRPALLIEIEERHTSRTIGEIFLGVLAFEYRGFFLECIALIPLEHFDVYRHRSMNSCSNSNSKPGYSNNFLFLHNTGIADGKYSALINGTFR